MGKLETRKVALVQRILESNDEDVIDRLTKVMDATEKQWLDSLPPRVRASVKRGLGQADRGEFIPDAEVRKRLKAWAKP